MRERIVSGMLGAAITVVAGTSISQAATINIQFGDPGSPATETSAAISGSPRYSGTAAAPDLGTNWNFFGGQSRGGDGQAFGGNNVLNNLTDSTGAATTVDFSAASVGYYLSPYRTGPSFGIGPNGVNDDAFDALTRSSLESPDKPRTFQVTGLAVNSSYRFFLYGAANHSQYEDFGGNAKFTIGGTTESTTGASFARTEFIEGRDYVVIDGVSNASGVVSIIVDATLQRVAGPDGTPVSDGFAQTRWTFNALQIQAVPEPGAVFALLTGAPALLLRRRQRHQSGR